MKIGSAAGAVLAGGAGSRMRAEKAAVRFGDGTLLDRAVRTLAEAFDRVLVVGRGPAAWKAPEGVEVIPDDEPGLGPLGGMTTALGAAKAPWVFVAACDMPFLSVAIIMRLWDCLASAPDAQACAPRLAGASQPLAAFYAREALGPLRELVGRGERRARRLLESVRATYLDVAPGSPEARALVNVNTPAELAAALGEIA